MRKLHPRNILPEKIKDSTIKECAFSKKNQRFFLPKNEKIVLKTYEKMAVSGELENIGDKFFHQAVKIKSQVPEDFGKNLQSLARRVSLYRPGGGLRPASLV